jgi:hypothetical protein
MTDFIEQTFFQTHWLRADDASNGGLLLCHRHQFLCGNVPSVPYLRHGSVL